MIQFFQEREGVPIQSLLEEFMLGFQYLYSAEKRHLKDEREQLTAEKTKFA
jgi:hypothetical protein